MKNIILSAENACDIPLEELDKKGIKHISLKLYNETKGEDANDMSLMQFYDAVKKGDIFKTSLINEYEFEEYFKEAGTLKNRMVRYLKTNIGKGSAKRKLATLLNEYEFINVEKAAETIRWEKQPLIQL